MKKLLSLVLALGLSLTLVACGSESKTDPKKDEVIAGFIYNGSISDGGYNQAHDSGRLAVEKELGIKTFYGENVTVANFEKVARGLIDQGVNVIFATSFEFMEPTVALSKEYPNVKFYHCSGYETTENMANYFGRIYETRYLAGMMAGLMTKNNHLGFVGAFPIPEVISSINAFTLGAQSVNPDIIVEVQWSNTWFDPVAEKEAAKALISNGVDVIAQHQNTTAVQQAAEEAGIYGIGYNLDMIDAAPKANLTSNIWNWGAFYIEAVKRVQEGKFEGIAYYEGIKSGLIDMGAYNKDLVSDEIIAQIDKAREDIIAGKLDVFKGEIKDQTGKVIVIKDQKLEDGDILGMDWFVEGVKGNLK